MGASSRWKTHLVVLLAWAAIGLAVLFFFEPKTVSTEGRSGLDTGLAVLAGVGEAAGTAALILMGFVAYWAYALVTTVLVHVLRSRRQSEIWVHALGSMLGVGVCVALVLQSQQEARVRQAVYAQQRKEADRRLGEKAAAELEASRACLRASIEGDRTHHARVALELRFEAHLCGRSPLAAFRLSARGQDWRLEQREQRLDPPEVFGPVSYPLGSIETVSANEALTADSFRLEVRFEGQTEWSAWPIAQVQVWGR